MRVEAQNYKNIHIILLGLIAALALMSVMLFIKPHVAAAATIIVDNADDNATASDGNCTLREAMNNALNGAGGDTTSGDCVTGANGSDTIEFEINSGGSTFTNQSQTGYTIALGSLLPSIDEPIVFNGYTQNGAQANNAIAPNPLNGILLVQIDGSALSSGDDGFWFQGGASGGAGSQVRGLVINGFDNGDAILISAEDIVVQGNYIGTTPDGSAVATTADANLVAVNNFNGGDSRINALIGGLDPEDRNILSGNEGAASYPFTGWILQGNYIGLAANGTSAIPNSFSSGPGSLSIDDCDGTLIGGTQPGAVNVISGNNNYGVAPDNATNLTIAGNLIGTDYTGENAVPNSYGIIVGGDATGSVIGGTTEAARNIISGNNIGGVTTGTTGGLAIQGNYIGLDIDGVEPLGNGRAGVEVAGQDEVVGGSVAARNVISGNVVSNVYFQGYNGVFTSSAISGSVVASNYIGVNASGNIDSAITAVQGTGVLISADVDGIMIGGDTASQANTIAGNSGYGIGVRTYVPGAAPFTWVPSNVSLVGNEIYNNIAADLKTTEGTATTIPDSEASLGIDIYSVTDAEPDFDEDTFTELGVTANDVNDVDTGPNAYMNFPVIDNATQNGEDLDITFDVEAADSTDGNYRVEFFANETADPSGYGEGQTYLGFATVANGNDQQVTLTLNPGADLSGQSITATTTAINGATASGYGATSEFSLAANVDVIAPAPDGETDSSGDLANTGFNVVALSLLAGGMMIGGGVLATKKLRG